MASKSSGRSKISGASGQGSTVFYCDFEATFSETAVNNEANTSKISWSAKADFDSNNGYSFSGTTRDEAGIMRIYMKYGSSWTLVGSKDVPLDSGSYPGYRLRTFTGTSSAIAHNADGTKTVKCEVDISSGTDPYGGGYVWSSEDGNSVDLVLTSIPRASKPTINTAGSSTNTFNLGDEITIYTNRKISNAKHTIKFVYPTVLNGQTVQNEVLVGTAANVQDSITFDTSPYLQDILTSFPNLGTIQGSIKCTTFNSSGTQIGSVETISYSAIVPDDAKPEITFESIIEETAANGGLAGKNVSDTTVVRYISKKKVTATITAKYGATITSAYVTDGTNSWNMTNSGSTYTATFTGITSENLTIVAVDSRGKETRYSITGLTYIPYEYPTIRTAAFVRSNASTGENSTILAAGTVYRGQTIGNVNPNVATVKYIKGSDSEATVAAAGVSYSGSDWSTNNNATIGTLDPKESYTGTVSVTDSFNQTVSFAIILPSVQNVVWFGKKTVRVHDVLIADNDIWVNDGAIKLTDIASLLSFENISQTGTFTNSSATKTYKVEGKGFVICNVWARASNASDTGQVEAWVKLLNSSNSLVANLAYSGNRLASAGAFQFGANAAAAYYFDGESTNNRLQFQVSCTKNNTTNWKITMLAIGCKVTAV